MEKTKPALKKRKKTKTVLAGEDAQSGGTDVVLHLSQVLKGVAAWSGLSLDEVFKIAKMTWIDEGADMGSMSSKTVPDESLALQLQAQENELEQRRRVIGTLSARPLRAHAVYLVATLMDFLWWTVSYVRCAMSVLGKCLLVSRGVSKKSGTVLWRIR